MTRARGPALESADPQDTAVEERSRKERTNDLVKTGADATVELMSGVADALGSAFRRAGEELEKDDLTRLGFKNGLVRGWFEGTSHFLEKMPDVVRSTYDVLSSADKDQKRS